MIDFSTFKSVQQITRDSAHSARPGAPIHPHRPEIVRHRGVVARQRISMSLRRIADIIQPVDRGMASPLPV